MQNKFIFKIALILFIISLSGCIHKLQFKQEPVVRIHLTSSTIYSTISSDCNIIVETNNMRGKSKSFSVWNIGIKGNKIYAEHNNKYIKKIGDWVKFYTEKPWGVLYLHGKGYKGALKFLYLNNKISVINEVNIEDYLKGVVPYEIGNLSLDKVEAVKAQAIAARTYAIRKMMYRKNNYFDLHSDIKDQVYKGIKENSDITDMACEDTRGLILTYKHKPIDAKYSSTCGGITADARELWTDKKVPYLTPVVDAKSRFIFKGRSFCSRSRYSNWEIKYNRNDFFKLLRENLIYLTGKQENEIGEIKNIKIVKRGPSRRVIEVIVYSNKGQYSIIKNNIRLLMRNSQNPSKSLLSTYFTIKQSNNNISIKGKGFGHGAGMCQYGAIGMASMGYGFREILKHYYHGARLEKVY
ncbi:SpoIID/LytB domain-containing protein [candidate division WOR-3 bacterium]|nr:SpoIID/LytB domain-containing protein [candidate division WOR-3 bacterium]